MPVVGSVLYSMPFVVQPLQNAFEAIGNRPLEAAATLRAGPWDCFFTVVLPLARPGVVTAATLGFAHTVGEFGVVLMIGGNIPGRTRVVSVQIACEKAGERGRGSVLASDAFFPFPDGVEAAARAGVTAIAQPGGSVNDAKVIAAACAS